MSETRIPEARAETMRFHRTEEGRYIETDTYDEETGYRITSVFPVMGEEERKEQAVCITKEMIMLMKEHANSGTCDLRSRML